MPGMNAVGMNTAASTSGIATTALPPSPMVGRAAGVGDELRRVVDDRVIDAFREIPLDLVHLPDHLLGGLKGVRAGALEDAEGDGRLAVEVRVRDVIARAT